MLLWGCKRPDAEEERRNTGADLLDGQQRRDAAIAEEQKMVARMNMSANKGCFLFLFSFAATIEAAHKDNRDV